MKKNLIIMMAALLCLGFVVADYCPEQFEQTQNCTMITPPISCATPTYAVLNFTSPDFSGVTVDSGSLYEKVAGTGIYEMNLSACDGGTPGDFLISLCDNTSRQVRCVSDIVNLSFISGQVSDVNSTLNSMYDLAANQFTLMYSCEPRVALSDTIICYVKASKGNQSGVQIDTLDVIIREPGTGDVWDVFTLADYTWDASAGEYYDLISIGPVETKGDYHVAANASLNGVTSSELSFFTISDVGFFDILLNIETNPVYRGSPFTFRMTVSQVSGMSTDFVYRYRVTTGDGQQSDASQVLFTQADSMCATLTCPHVVTMNVPFTQNRESGELCVQIEREDGSIVKPYSETCTDFTVHLAPVDDNGATFSGRVNYIYHEYHSYVIAALWILTSCLFAFFIAIFFGKKRKNKQEGQDLEVM